MGLFDFLKKEPQKHEEAPKDKYWSLTTAKGEVIDPTWQQVEETLADITQQELEFVSLGYVHSDLDIEIVQALDLGEGYRVEALPPESSYDYGKAFVNSGIFYEEMVRHFKEFHDTRRVSEFRSWPKEKI